MAYKIGIVCFPTYGGSGAIATELGQRLAEQQYEVHFISSSPPFRLQSFRDRLYYHEVGTYEYPLFEDSYYTLSLASKIVNLAKSHRLDLLHVHYAIPHAIAAYLAREVLRNEGRYLPIITTLHGTDITLIGKDVHFSPMVRFSIDASDAVTAVSQALRKETIQHFKPKKPIEVVYNFVNVARFQAPKQMKKHLVCKKEERMLIHISNLRKVKRVADVVKIFLQVQQHIPARLVVIGDGPERGAMETLCHTYNIKEQVHFFGKVTAVEDMLNMADLLLLPSAKESFGLSALEAMAAHTPVIASEVGGLPELLQNGLSGFMCPVGDTTAMAEKALHILSSQHLKAFKARAFQQAQAFDISRIVPQYEKIYQQVLKRSPSSASVA